MLDHKEAFYIFSIYGAGHQQISQHLCLLTCKFLDFPGLKLFVWICILILLCNWLIISIHLYICLWFVMHNFSNFSGLYSPRKGSFCLNLKIYNTNLWLVIRKLWMYMTISRPSQFEYILYDMSTSRRLIRHARANSYSIRILRLKICTWHFYNQLNLTFLKICKPSVSRSTA